MIPKKLTKKQQAFVDAYAVCRGDAAKAAIAAGYSESRAGREGTRLLSNADVLKALGLHKQSTGSAPAGERCGNADDSGFIQTKATGRGSIFGLAPSEREGASSPKEAKTARRRFWSAIMLDEEQPIQARLKASEYYAKCDGDFGGGAEAGEQAAQVLVYELPDNRRK